MSEKKVYLVFVRVSYTELWQLIGTTLTLENSLAVSAKRLNDGWSVTVRKISVYEAQELEIIPGAFGCVPFVELPGEHIWTSTE
jgi:hypothetical protein